MAIHPLKWKRIGQGKTQWDLAAATSMSQTEISLIETGKITDIAEDKKKRIAKALRVDVREIFPSLSSKEQRIVRKVNG